MGQLEENDLFNVIKKALIIITPEGEVITVEDDNQEYHRELFTQTRNAIIQELSKRGINGRIKSQILSQNGHTVLIGNKASSSQGEDYYYKILNLPSAWKKKKSEEYLKELLRGIQRIDSEFIDKGLALEIRIITPNGRYVTIYYLNDEFKNKRFKAEEVAKLIESKQGELENENNNQRPGGWYI